MIIVMIIVGICRAVYKKITKAYGGDKVGDTCLFPFDYNGVTYSSCVDDNSVRGFSWSTRTEAYSPELIHYYSYYIYLFSGY